MIGLTAQSRALKAHFPDIQVATCGRCQWAEMIRHTQWPEQPQVYTFPDVDIFIPRSVGYVNTSAAAFAQARGAKKSVGWYTSGIPGGYGGLNWFLECARYAPSGLRLSVAVLSLSLPLSASL